MLSHVLYLVVASLAFSAHAGTQSDAFELNERGLKAADVRDFAAAERNYRAASDIYRSLGAPYQAHLSVTLFNLAEVLYSEGDWQASREMFEQSLALSRRTLGPKHLRTVTCLNALGHVQMAVGDAESAESNFAEALAIARELYPKDLQVAHSLAGFAALRLRAGNPEAGLPYADEALKLTTEVERPEGLDSALMYQLTGQIHRMAGRPERALPLLRRSRALYEKVRATEDPRYAMVLSQEGLALMDDGKFGAAGAEMEHAIALLQKCPGCAFQLAMAQNNLGLLRIQQKKYGEAGDLLRLALSGEERYTPAGGPEVTATRKALEQLRSELR